MPPKNAPNKKTQEKQKAKVVEDKTFGLKNKKGAKQQKFIQQVEKQVKNTGQPQARRDLLDPAAERLKRKEEEAKKKEELTQLFKPVTQTVGKGVDPKSVVCVFFKQGLCQKGDKCKFSHDLTKERKTEKRSIYEDVRDGENETMADWDEKKLEDVVNTKHGEDNLQKNTTQIVCKFFIEAVENATYGWFWKCPNEKDGGKCIYRHALPPGFTLKKDKKSSDQDDEIALETLIEKERAALGAGVTKVTLESFLAWKARKIKEKKDKALEQDEKKKRDFKLGFVNGLTGRDLFTFNPDLIANDDESGNNDDIDYKHRADDDEDQAELDQQQRIAHEINLEALAAQAREVDNTGTIAGSDRFDYMKAIIDKEKKIKEAKEAAKLDMACGGVEDLENVEEEEEDGEKEEGDEAEEQEEDEDATKEKNNLDIDESLFNVDDLGDIADELENLDV